MWGLYLPLTIPLPSTQTLTSIQAVLTLHTALYLLYSPGHPIEVSFLRFEHHHKRSLLLRNTGTWMTTAGPHQSKDGLMMSADLLGLDIRLSRS